jgi:D-alanyl-D-alanine carboxypeptidase
MKKLLSSYSIIVLLVCVLSSPIVAQAPNTGKDLATALNAEAEKGFKPNEPGAAVIVVKDGQVVFRKGYGMANLELGVPIEPDMIFRIGSITKQFTAVGTLMLMEQGKLSLSDEITKFLPDYPTQGQKITVEHLLTHTSGIKSYTELPEFWQQQRKDLPLKELIDFFKNKPMDFAPGERWNYNNSAYVLLGAVIEKASGQKYADFVEQHIFAPLGMKQTSFDVTTRIIPRRAVGYQKSGNNYTNAEYLSMSLPHAAGSLISSVDDLAKWDAALYTEKLVKQDSLKRAWAPYVLKNGRQTNYGYGWGISTLQGQRMITHGGGINGFTCDAVRLPDARVYVAILTNRNGGVGNLAQKLAIMTSGKEWREPVAVKLPVAALDKLTGVYQLNEKEEVVVTRQNEALFVEMPRRGKQEVLPLSEAEFFLKLQPSARVSFQRQENGTVSALLIRAGFGPDDEAKRTDKPLSAPKTAVTVDPAVYDRYVGEYELAPNFILTITKENNKLMGQATGQPKFELTPESEMKFSIVQVGAQIEFTVESGKATQLILNQGGRTLPAKKIK